MSSQSKRDAIRAAVFAKKAKRKTVPYAGMEVEVLQPTIGDALGSAGLQGEEKQNYMIEMLIKYVYVPSENVKVFEEADREGLRSQPFDSEMMGIVNAINELMGLSDSQVAEAKKDLEGNL